MNSKGIVQKFVILRQGTIFACPIHTANSLLKDYYKTLRIETDASSLEVKEAYLKLTKKYHPDVNQSEDAKQIFQEITEAYEVLGSEKGRHEYDNRFTSRLRRIRQRTKRTPEKTSDPRSYEDIHKIIKERYKDEKELFREWARREDESTKMFFKRHSEKKRNERKSNPKNIPEDFYDTMTDNAKRKEEEEENKKMFKYLILLSVGLMLAFLLEKIS